ncbi:50S ribosomal protein L25/general stress protein Ctc [Vicingus serpentipes]|uniref:Large ribosomal subunit protein bL25 n=1 Tax=Vicingus serpentipes TaxID=1926625 RepID=A0A5C6RSV8_9FLAO|nr:50S ribosomal protein L25/general stress protein Ctc [Vicingus serpentipes]TXB65139.1 50S ribosomal protein L25/general stress protein Ctc [Vicingus serpentipes]
MKSIALQGNKRADRGTTDAKALRSAEKIPAVLYGGKENTHFTVNEIQFGKIIHSPNVYFINLDIDGSTHRAIIKDVQFHPVTDRVLHIDFLEVVEGKAITVNMPIKLTGNSRGVLNGGKLRTVTRRLKVNGLAETLPEFITIDITNLRIGQSIKVGDIQVDGLRLLDAANAVVVAVKRSRVSTADEDEDEDEEGAEAATSDAAEASAE